MKFMGVPISSDVSFDLDFFGECHKERENGSATQYNYSGFRSVCVAVLERTVNTQHPCC